MGPVLLDKETKVPKENPQCWMESNMMTPFSHMTKVTLIGQLHRVEIGFQSHSSEGHVHSNCATNTLRPDYNSSLNFLLII